jgi:hypothetical protein
MSVRPPEDSVELLGARCHHHTPSSRMSASFRVLSRRSIALWVRRSRSAVGRSLGFAVFPLRVSTGYRSASGRPPLIEFRLPRSLAQLDLAGRPKPPTPLLGFHSLQHMQGSKVHLPRALPARYVPPSGFGYPPGGLLPSIPGRFCFTPAALLGFTLRSHPSSGIRTFPHECTHVPFRTPLFPIAEATGRPGGPRFLGFHPDEGPGSHRSWV